jgi:hypothetical protein
MYGSTSLYKNINFRRKSMARTVVALYDDFTTANDVVRDLIDHGFSRDDISLMASDAAGEYGTYLGGETTADYETSATASGAGVGAGIGAVLGGLGGLLVGLGALVIPGIGPVVAAGPLAAALSGLAGAGVGAVAGGVTGGLIGALVDMGLPEEEAQYYSEGVRRGGTLVTVQAADHMADQARDVMNRYNPVDINERVSSWRERGWTGFEPDAEPYDIDEIERERQYYGTSREMDREVGIGTGYDDDFAGYHDTFHQHYETSLANTGYPYGYYEPGYRFGHTMASEGRYTDRDWNEVEPEFRREWERDRPGTWEEFKSSVRHAWEEVKDAFR